MDSVVEAATGKTQVVENEDSEIWSEIGVEKRFSFFYDCGFNEHIGPDFCTKVNVELICGASCTPMHPP